MRKKILVCLDGTSFSEQIIPYIIKEHRHLDSRVVLLQVVSVGNITASLAPASHQPAPPVYMEALIQQQINRAASYLDAVANNLAAAGRDVEWVVLTGTVAQEIIDYARENDAAYIAMVTHNRKGLNKLLYGSVAETVIKETHLPVFLLRSPKTGKAVFEKVQFSELHVIRNPQSAIYREAVSSGA